MKYEDLPSLVEKIKMHGPTRVLVNQFEGRPTHIALRDNRITPDVVFIRDDGWSLGAPKDLVWHAEMMWADKWVFVVELNNGSQGYEYPDWKEMRRQ